MSVSLKALQYEKDVESYLQSLNIEAIRPTCGTNYSDILIYYNKTFSWIEVKMNHKDNLCNVRIFFNGFKWDTTYSTPIAQIAVDILNNSPQATQFIENITKYSNITSPIISTTKSMLKELKCIPLNVMKSFVSQPNMNRYILKETNYNVSEIVKKHYLKGKEEPVYYISTGDDFFKLDNNDPFNLNVPLFEGFGCFNVRVSTRSEFYEIQTEIKLKDVISSPYSIKPFTNKINPFK